MAVIYLFDSEKKLKKTVKKVSEIIHREGEYQAEAHITAKDSPDNGDFFGFRCLDGLFRMFLINAVDEDDETGECTLTGIDAAAAELDGIVVERLSLENISPIDALHNVLDGKGWSIRYVISGDDFTAPAVYYQTAWTVLETISRYGNVRLQMEYAFENGAISQKIIWVRSRDEGFSGLIYTRKKGARNIQITKEGTPYGRVYPIGKVIGDEEPPEQVTIADAVWSVANGDPTDKPAGQTWIAIPGAKSEAGYVYEDKTETDPLALMKKGYADLESKQQWKASGTALISDMETIGWSNRGAEMWQSIAIRTESGQTIEATILNIERYYVRKELTKVTVGEETTLEDQIIGMNTLLAETVKAAGGAGAGAGKAQKMVLEAEELIQLNSQKIEANAGQLITLRVATEEVRTELDETIVSFNETKLTIEDLKGELSTTKTDVNNAANEVNQLKGSVTTLAGQVELKASQSSLDDLGNLVEEHEAYIKVLPGQIEAKADRIDLEAYVKIVGGLEADVGDIQRIFAGQAQADNLFVNQTVSAQTGQFTNVSLINYDAAWKDLTMGDIKPGISYLGKKTQGAIDLEHSHKLVYNEETGTFTLAGVSSSGDSFNIADTQFYKDGVEAAAKLVTFSPLGWVGKQNTVKGSNDRTATVLLPSMTKKSVDSWNTLHKTYARLGYNDSNGSYVEAGWVEVDASDVYLAGKEAGMQEAGTDYTEGYEKGKADWNPVLLRRETYSVGEKTVFVRAVNENDVSLIWANIDASEIFDEGEQVGFNSVTITQTGWLNGMNVVVADNERRETVLLPTFSSAIDEWNSLHKTYVRLNYINVNGTAQQAAMAEVDASEIYDAGKSSVTIDQSGWIGKQNTVTASNSALETVLLPTMTEKSVDEWNTLHKTYARLGYNDSNGSYVEAGWVEVDASSIYDEGSNDVTIGQTGWVGKVNTVIGTNKALETVLLPTMTEKSVDEWNTLHKTYARLGYIDSNGDSVEAGWVEVDASEIYSAGVTKGSGEGYNTGFETAKESYNPTVISRTGYDASAKTVTVKAANAKQDLLTDQVIDASEIYDAGKSSVTIDQSGWIGKQNTVTASNSALETVLLPTMTEKSVDEWNSLHKTYARLGYNDSNGSYVEAGWVEVDGSQIAPYAIVRENYDSVNKWLTVNVVNKNDEVLIQNGFDVWDIFDSGYLVGWGHVTATPQGWVQKQNTVLLANNKRATVLLPTMTEKSVDEWNTLHKTYARLGYKDSNGDSVEAGWVEVDASSIYNKGKNGVTFAPSGWVGKINVVEGSNDETATVLLPSMTEKSVDEWNTLHKTYARLGYKDSNDNYVEAGWVEVDASSLWEEAWTAGFEEAKSLTEVRGEITDIVNTAKNTFQATGYARALVGEEQVDSTTFYKTKEIKIGQ